MNLKDAFRAQNKLQALMDEAGDILQDRDNTLRVTTTHLRSKVMPEAQDAVIEDAAPSEYAEHINQVGRLPDVHAGGAGESQRRHLRRQGLVVPGHGQRDRPEPGQAESG